MDRRHLILTSAGLVVIGTGRSALAQTPLPPARPTPQDAPPAYQPSEAAPPAYPPATTYSAPPSYSPPTDYSPAPEPPMANAAPAYMPPPTGQPQYPANTSAQTYSREELVNNVSDFLGVTAETAGSAVERVFRDNGRPTGYIAGEEASGAFIGGLRYGKGLLYMKNQPSRQVFWQGPTVGFDWGGNASRVFTLCYNLQYEDAIFRRFPGVEGSAYLIGGLGVNYQRAEDIVLAPLRAGVGLRLGANVGYLSYSRRRNWVPL